MKLNLYVAIVVALTIGAVSSVFLRYIFFKDYRVLLAAPCDPAIESCFVSECDIEQDTCAHDQPKTYYKKVYKNKSILDLQCAENWRDCPSAFLCYNKENDCKIVTCSEDTDPIKICDSF
jgi:hypothetical protein